MYNLYIHKEDAEKRMDEEKEHTAFYPDDTPPETGNYPVTASLKYYFKTHIENTFRTENLDEKNLMADIPAESTVNALLRKNNILEISDAPSPFGGRVDTVVLLIQKSVC